MEFYNQGAVKDDRGNFYMLQKDGDQYTFSDILNAQNEIEQLTNMLNNLENTLQKKNLERILERIGLGINLFCVLGITFCVSDILQNSQIINASPIIPTILSGFVFAGYHINKKRKIDRNQSTSIKQIKVDIKNIKQQLSELKEKKEEMINAVQYTVTQKIIPPKVIDFETPNTNTQTSENTQEKQYEPSAPKVKVLSLHS